MKKRISIKQIAEDLGVSTTTVSFVLNGKSKEKHISKEMTERVLNYAKKVNYKPNPIARSLRTGKTNTLVLIVEDISNIFFAKLDRIIEEIAYQKGYKVIFCSHENDDQKFQELIAYFKNRMIDGFIIVPSSGTKHLINELIEENNPVVLIDRYFENLNCNVVVVDNKEASYSATNHLISNRYKNIAFVTVDLEQTQMRERLQGYEQAVKDSLLKAIVLKVPFEIAREIKGKQMIFDFIQSNKEIDSVFFATNYLTQGGLEIFNSNNPDLIKKIGIVAFDENEFFKIHNPAITAVSQPLTEIGSEMMRIMELLLKSKKVKVGTKKIVLNAKLIVRDSSLSKNHN